MSKRVFAVPKNFSLTDRIAMRTTQGLRPVERAFVGRVLVNQSSAYDRINGRWARGVRRAIFAGRS
jgi:hypothetical protein